MKLRFREKVGFNLLQLYHLWESFKGRYSPIKARDIVF